MSHSMADRVRTLSRVLSVIIAVLVFVGDQLTKAMVERFIPDQAVIPIIPHFFNLTHTRNAGAAFGLFSQSPSPGKTVLLIVISLALLAAVVWMVIRSRQFQWETSVGLAFILGGALSNLFDRIRVGSVVDFLDFYINGYHWPAFNLADSAIVVGAAFLIFSVVFSE